MVDPRLLCRQHLLGEHNEIHMLAGCILHGKSIDGYIEKELVFPELMVKRHDTLVREMWNRGYAHKSRMPDIPHTLMKEEYNLELTKAIIHSNMKDLAERCTKCFGGN